MEHFYDTITDKSEGVYREKGSKFIGYALPFSDETDLKEQILVLKKEHQQARHFCFAYRIGLNGEKYRASDDGEPSNSAGQPILGQLVSFNITNCLVVVVRYFGGTKLGVGGLITAYRTAAQEALKNATIIQKEMKYWVELTFSYDDMPAIMQWIKQEQLESLEQKFELICTIKIGIPIAQKNDWFERWQHIDSLNYTEIGIY